SLGRLRFELRMALDRHEPGVTSYLDHLHQLAVLTSARKRHAFVRELLSIFIIEFVPMAMAFLDNRAAVGLMHLGARLQCARVGAETHGAAHVGDSALLVQQTDDRIFTVAIDFRSVGIIEANDVAGKLDDGALQAETNAEKGYISLSGMAN